MLKKSLVLMAILYSQLNAGAIDNRYYYQDYMDFGANKGRFKAGATNLNVNVQNTGKTFKFNTNKELNFDFPMVDFSASNQTGYLKGEFTNIGSNRVITAAHMIMQDEDDSSKVQSTALTRYKPLQFGGVNTLVASTSNNFAIWTYNDTNDNKEDFMIMRMTKLNLNKKALVSNMDFYDENGKDKHTKAYNEFKKNKEACSSNTSDACKDYQSWEQFKDKSAKAELFLENNQEPNSRYKFFARSGSGLQIINEVSEKDTAINTFINTSTNIENYPKTNGSVTPIKAGLYFTGGLIQITKDVSESNEHTIHADSFLGKNFKLDKYGNVVDSNEHTIDSKQILQEFSNTAAKGDSGSALYVYDSLDKAWYVVGVVSTTDCGSGTYACHTTNFHLVNKKMINDFDTGYTVNQKTFSHKLEITKNLNSAENNTLSDGANTISSISSSKAFHHYYDTAHPKTDFEARINEMADNKDLFINGGTNLTLTNNLDLGSSALIFKENLGEYNITGDKEFLHGGLDISKGTTVNYEAKTSYYDFLHVIGDGKLNVKSSSINGGIRIGGGDVEFKTGTNKAFGSVYLTNNAKLKINNEAQIDTNYLYFGKNAGSLDLNAQNLSFTNIKASDIGTNITNLNTAKSIVTLNENTNTSHIYHGSISGNIDITHTSDGAKSAYIYDGGLDIKNMNVNNQEISLQGHPIIHEYINNDIKNTIAASNGGSVFTSPTTLNQNDWEDRIYNIEQLTLDNASLEILKHSTANIANIKALNNSTITLGINQAYIDKYDGENIKTKDTVGSTANEAYDSNLSYKEEITKGQSTPKNINLNASINLGSNSSLQILNNATFNGSITSIDETSKLIFDGANINANINASNLNASNTNFIYKDKNNALNITKSSLGSNNTIEITSDFLGGDDKYLLASLTNDNLVSQDYFQIKGSESAFSSTIPNVKYCSSNNTASWYLAKTSLGDICNNTSNDNSDNSANTSPLIPLQPSTPITPPSVDNPNQNDKPEEKPNDKQETPLTPLQPSTPITPPSVDNPNQNDKPEEKPNDKQETPLTPLQPSTPIAQPLDPNPNNNPSNKESLGHYKEYFFVKEKKEAIKTAEKTLNQAFFNYVLEWNNMQKRMGELRDEVANAGVWLRTYGGASTYLKQNKTKYLETQIGADKISEFDNFKMYSGILLTHSRYSLDTKNMLDGKIVGYGGGAYASLLFDNGFYLDFIAKYTDFKNDYVLNLKNGNEKTIKILANNHTKNILASAEIGARFNIDENYFEPSLELITGYVGAINLTNKAEHIKLTSKAFVPLNTKAMLSFGKQSSEANALGYKLGVGLAADILKSGKKSIRDLNVIRHIDGKRDARMLTNASLSYNFSNDFRVFAEFERSFFGDMNVDYSFNITLRKSF